MSDKAIGLLKTQIVALKRSNKQLLAMLDQEKAKSRRVSKFEGAEDLISNILISLGEIKIGNLQFNDMSRLNDAVKLLEDLEKRIK